MTFSLPTRCIIQLLLNFFVLLLPLVIVSFVDDLRLALPLTFTLAWAFVSVNDAAMEVS